MKYLNKNFVSGWENIKGQTPYAGTSNTHQPSYDAKTVSNCAGHHNVQMFFLTSDGKVIHCLPGFWSPKYFMHEAKLAVDLARIYYKKKSKGEKTKYAGKKKNQKGKSETESN